MTTPIYDRLVEETHQRKLEPAGETDPVTTTADPEIRETPEKDNNDA